MAAINLLVRDLAELNDCARALALRSQAGDRLYLSGPLGVGKTTFVRAYLRALGHEGTVKSPTYTLVEPYILKPSRQGGTPRSVAHCDLYRLGPSDDWEELGLRDYFSPPWCALVEWPEHGERFLPQPTLHLILSFIADNAQAREINLHSTEADVRNLMMPWRKAPSG